MKTCRLKNNSIEAMPVVLTTMINIKSLMKVDNDNPMASMQNMLALYELGKIAHDSNHKLWNNELGTILQKLALLNDDNTLHSSVKNIAQSAIRFEEEMPIIENPIVEVLGENL